jgi:hypothetical protein
MRYSSRFWLYAPICMFLGLAAWAGIHWWNVASALNRKLDAMKGHEAMPGIVIDWQAKTVSGFPFNLDLVFTGLSVKGAGAHGPFAWSAEKFALHTLTYEQNKRVMEAGGRQALRWTGTDGAPHDLAFLPAELHASAVLDGRGLARFDLDILDAGSKDFTASRMQFHLLRDFGKLDLMGSADHLLAGRGNFDSPLENLSVYATLTKASGFAALMRGEEAWPQAAARWRLGGGEMRPGAIRIKGSSKTFRDANGAAAIIFGALY